MIIWSLSFIVIIIVIIILSAYKQIASSVSVLVKENARGQSRIRELLALLMPIYFDCPLILSTFEFLCIMLLLTTQPPPIDDAAYGWLITCTSWYSLLPRDYLRSTHSQWHLLYSSNWRWLVNYFTSNTLMMMMMMMRVISMNHCVWGWQFTVKVFTWENGKFIS